MDQTDLLRQLKGPQHRAADPCVMVIFGASGDLTQRKLIPALASLCGKGRPKEGFSVLGVARREKTDEAFRN